ncbi:MAG: ABC transporter substrate-binding protein [Alphaproteobacteria bacterium]|nr:ABC transporter substrate-binding protein [Alphaproteobacteria bacterium]
MVKKISWKNIIGWVVAIVVIFGVIGYNAYQAKQQSSSGKPKVYAVLPLSGSVADLGQRIKSYMTIYMDNTDNVPFEIIYLDDESKPDKAVSVFQQIALSEEKPIVISAFSFISRILIPIVEKQGGFTFALTTIEGKQLGLSSGYQRVASGIYDGKAIIEYAKRFNTVSIINMEDDFGVAGKDLFIKEYQADGRKILNTVSLPLRSFDVRNEVQKIIENPPEAVFFSGTVTLAYINAIRILKESGYQGKIIANHSISDPYTYRGLGELADGIIAQTVPADVEEIDIRDNKLLETLKKENIPAFFLPIQVFDTMNLIKYTFDNNLPFTQDTYTKMEQWNGVSGTVKLNNGDSFYSYVVAEIKDGRFVLMEE